MPRLRQNADEYRKKDFASAVRSRLAGLELEQHDLAIHLGVSDGTVSVMLKDPDKMPVSRLMKVIAFLELEPEAALKFLGYATKNIKKVIQ